MGEKNQKQVKEVPVGVKIISVLYYIIAALCVIILVIGSFSFLGGMESPNVSLIFILAIFLAGGAILCFFLGRGLWRGQNWSRIVAIIIAILNIIVTIVMFMVISTLSIKMTSANIGQNVQNILEIFDIRTFIPKAIITIGINAIIAFYLLFSSKVKEAFK
jgi:hypothetical protein